MNLMIYSMKKKLLEKELPKLEMQNTTLIYLSFLIKKIITILL